MCPLNTGALGFCLNWKRTVLLIQVLMAEMGFHFQNLQNPGIAPRQKLPLPNTGASYGKEPSLLHRHSWPKLVFLFQNSLYTRVSPRQKLPRQRALAGLGIWWSPLICPGTLGLHAFLPLEKNHLSSPWLKLGFQLLKSYIH